MTLCQCPPLFNVCSTKLDKREGLRDRAGLATRLERNMQTAAGDPPGGAVQCRRRTALCTDGASSERRRVLGAVCRGSRGLFRAERSSSRAARGSEGDDARSAPSSESQNRRCRTGRCRVVETAESAWGRFAEVRRVYPERSEVAPGRPAALWVLMLEARHRRNRGIGDARRVRMRRRCCVVGAAENASGGL